MMLLVKNPSANAGDVRDSGSIPESGRQPTLVFLPVESHGQRSLAGYSPWDHRESDTTEGNLAAALLRNFASMLFRDIDLSFSVFMLSLFSFGIRVIVVL